MGITINTISAKKQKLIDDVNNSEIKVDDRVTVKEGSLQTWTNNSDRNITLIITRVVEPNEVFKAKSDESYRNDNAIFTIEIGDIISRNIRDIGENPFPNNSTNGVRPIAYELSSIIFSLNLLGEKKSNSELYKMNDKIVHETNFNPYIYDKEGKKVYYQRPLVWSLKDKQLLIESIYEGIDCGKVIVRMRSWKYLEALSLTDETELFFRDVVDGKQRLNAVVSFINDEFVDLHGNNYSDLSATAQHLFTNNQLFSYAEMPESTKDEEVIEQFLKLNFTGVQQSEEHLNYVKSIKNKF